MSRANRSEQIQRGFAARVRNPSAAPIPEAIPADRVAVYERLFYNSIESFVSGTFPVLHSLLSAERWTRLVSRFIAEHQCRSPYFLEIGQEFIAWLQQRYFSEPDDPPYMLELAHYEWVELALDTATAELPVKASEDCVLDLHTLLSASPLAWPLAYQWPVNRIGPDYRPTEAPAQPTCLMVWRDRKDKVRFMQLTGFTFQLLTRLRERETTPAVLLGYLADQNGLACDEGFMANGLGLLKDWIARDIVLPASALSRPAS